MGCCQQHAPLNRSGFDSPEVDRRSLPGVRLFYSRAVNLDAAHAHAPARQKPDREGGCRQQVQFVAFIDLSGNQGSGNNRAESFDREGAIYRQARDEIIRASRGPQAEVAQSVLQFINPLARARADRDDRLAFEKRSLDQVFALGARELEQLFIDQIFYGENNDSFADAEQATDVEVLAGLRHHALVRGDDQGDRIDAVRTRQHVLHKAFVTGNIDKADTDLPQIEIRKTNIDRDAAALFFRQAISIDTRERAHQRSLAVIYMPSRTNNDRLHLELVGRGYN